MANKKENTQEQFGKLVNLSQPEVSKLVREGLLTRGATIGQWLGEYIEHLRSTKAGWTSSDGQVDRIREAGLLDRSKRVLIDLQIAERTGRVLPVAAVVESVRFIHVAIRSKLLGLPNAYRNKVARLTAKEVDLLHDMVLEILAELSNERFPPAILRVIERDMGAILTPVETDDQRVGGPVPNPKPRKQR